MSNGAGKQHHAERILSAKGEPEVTTALDEFARTFDVDWTPIGGQDNNYGVVENQSSSPLGALNEIVSNGIDAILRRRYRERHSRASSEWDQPPSCRIVASAATRRFSPPGWRTPRIGPGQLFGVTAAATPTNI